MALPKRILVVVDPTADTQPAVQRAAWIARKTLARVELFICAYAPELLEPCAASSLDISKARKAHVETQLRRLRALARPLAAEGIPVSVDAVWDSPLHESIARKVLAAGADLVLKDAHDHAALQRSIFSNTDWDLIRACPVPLWLVKPRATGPRPCCAAAVDPTRAGDAPAELDHEIPDIGAELTAALHGHFEPFRPFGVAPTFAAAASPPP